MLNSGSNTNRENNQMMEKVENSEILKAKAKISTKTHSPANLVEKKETKIINKFSSLSKLNTKKQIEKPNEIIFTKTKNPSDLKIKKVKTHK